MQIRLQPLWLIFTTVLCLQEIQSSKYLKKKVLYQSFGLQAKIVYKENITVSLENTTLWVNDASVLKIK